MTKPTVGLIFDHPRVRDNRDLTKPAKFRVTRIALGRVYIKECTPWDSEQVIGYTYYVSVDEFPDWVKTGRMSK